jgi:hypothetical protein
MGVKDLIELCKQLSKSQGFYGRLLRQLQEADDDTLNEINKTMLKHNFKDTLDIVLWVEG